MLRRRHETLQEELLRQAQAEGEIPAPPEPVPPPQDEPLPGPSLPRWRHLCAQVLFGICAVCGTALLLAGETSALWGTALGWVLAVTCVASGVAGNALIGGFDGWTGSETAREKPQYMWRNW